ncbi:hypothetical protein XH92_02530 [Bradyrhizobium sp. CCBAU 53421]|nr:hypothetical protein XH92_02530 [Bradyrhizobium sp. CCBAU 53421]
MLGCLVIASEAKQSIVPRRDRMDCFVASLLAMTTWLGEATRSVASPPHCRRTSGSGSPPAPRRR